MRASAAGDWWSLAAWLLLAFLLCVLASAGAQIVFAPQAIESPITPPLVGIADIDVNVSAASEAMSFFMAHNELHSQSRTARVPIDLS